MKKLYFFLLTVVLVNLSQAQVQIGAVNYPTLRAAFTAINAGAHTGDISILITGNTTETNFATLNGSGMPDGIGGHASYTSVVISPSGTETRTILFTGSQGYVTLDGASNVTFDGLNLLTIANAIPNSRTIVITNSAMNNTFRNCKILGSGSPCIISVQGGILSGSNNTTISHCDIGPFDGNIPVCGISVDSGIYSAQYGITITDNNIYDYNSQTFTSAGINIGGMQAGINIQNNRFYQTAPRASLSNYGIYIILSQGQVLGSRVISGNEIGSANASGTGMYTLTSGKFTGILYQYTNGDGLVSINDNNIRNIAVSGNASGTFSNSPLMGIAVREGLAEVKRNTIGNMSQAGSLVFSTSSGASSGVVGIYKDGRGNIDVSDNNIGSISASGGGRVDVYGIYMEKTTDSYPSMICSGNTIGGTNVNSIISTSTTNATVAGIFEYSMLGPTKNNTIRNLTGYGSGVSNDPTGVIGIKSFVGEGGIYGHISDNTIFNLTNANPASASYLGGIFQSTSGNNSTIERNFIHSLTSLSSNTGAVVTGIHVWDSGANLYNNMIAIGETTHDAARIWGIRCEFFAGYNPNIFNNSIYIGGTASYGNANSFAFYQDGSMFNFYNRDNIYVNNRTNAGGTGTHSSIRVDMWGSAFRGNIYYGNGNGYILGYNGTTPKSTLAAWNSWGYPGTDYGYFTDPHFIAPTAAVPNLHIDPTVPTMAEGHGNGATGDDIDLELRGGLTPNDIGADAGNFIGIMQPVITGLSATSVCTTDNAVLTITGTGFTGVTQVKIGTTPMTILNASETSIEVPAGNVPLSGNVLVTNEFATGGSASVFNVYAPPVITQQPVAGNVCTNTSITFSVAATGSIGSYQWLLDGVPLTDAAPFSNVTTAAMTVTNPDISYNGHVFSVIVNTLGNACSVTSDTATLTVFQQPAPIIQVSGDTTFCAGNSVTLSTTLPYATYHWSNGAVTPSIVVAATGNYSVTVTNANSCSVTSDAVTVTANPNITYYADADSDLYGNPGITAVSCMGAPVGFVAENTDCNDNDNTKHQTYPFYVDADGDSYGWGSSVNICNASASVSPSGYVLNNTDCNDNNITIYQNAILYTDLDGDNYSTASAVVCYGASIPAGYSLISNGSDCDDSDFLKHETYAFYADTDNDTYGATDVVMICATDAGSPPSGYVFDNSDCDDSDALKHQTYPFYFDYDNDGYGAGSLADVCAIDAINPPMWFSLNNIDCDNGNQSIYPGAPEILYDGIDNNCDGQLDEGFQIKTKLIPADCGATLAALSTTISILPVADVWAYRVKAVSTTGEETILVYLPEFKMTDFTSYAYATTYSISIEIMRSGGVWLGYYGDVCQVTTPTQANGIYESYAIVSSNGGSNVVYDMQATTANADFNGANLGTFIPGVNMLTLKGGQNKIFDYNCPVSNSNLYYRVYKTGTAPGTFNIIPQSFVNDIETPGGQLWEGVSGTENLVAGLANGNYILEVYSSAGFECAPFVSFSNNSGNNYKATFSVTSQTPVVVTATSGTPTASYANVTAAFSAINAQVHQGDIIITIMGNTFEQGSGAILFPGASYNSIRIVPEGDVTVSAHPTTGTAVVINIMGGHDITIDGLNTIGNSLTITNPYNMALNSAPITVSLNNCNNITLTNCRLLGHSKYIYNSFNGTSALGGMTLSALATHNATISNCDFGAANNQHLPMYSINAWGDNYVIANNKIHDYFAEDVLSAGLYNSGTSSNWIITGNLFYQTVSRSWQYNGSEHCAIIVAPASVTGTAPGVSQGFTITGNTIGYASATQTGTYNLRGNAMSPKARFCGIRFKGLSTANALPTIISNNTIASVSLTETTSRGAGATSPFVGISFESGVGTCSGNVIGSQVANASLIYSAYNMLAGAADVYGIVNLSANPFIANNNTIGGITANNTGSSPISVFGIKSTGASWSATGNTIGGAVVNSIQLTASGASQMFGIQGTEAGTLTGNTISNLTANNTATGIQSEGANSTLSRNLVYSLAGSGITGIRISGGTSTSTNNMIALGNGIENATINGFYDAGTGNSIYNNSVYIGGTATGGNVGSFALFTDAAGSRTYINNILVNNRTNNGGDGKHYGIGISSIASLTMNRNVYYSTGTGSVFGRLDSQDINNLNVWKTATAQDSGSFVSNPKYIDPTASTPNLHINPAVVSIVESNGDILPSVTEDFDGNVRSGLTPADIGADAGNFTAPPPAITSLNVLSGCPGTSLVITGSNMGHVTSVTIGGTPATITAATAFSVTVAIGTENTGVVMVYDESGATATAPEIFTLIPLVAYFQDGDGDGYGNPTVMQLSCPIAPAGFVADNTDCDDTKNTVHPNAVEIGYNLIDDDCDGSVDEGFPPKVTVIQSAQCNAVLAAIDSQLTANIVAGAQGYRWRITTMSGASAGQVQQIDTPLRVMKLTQLASYAFNTQYKVEISVLYAGFWQPFTASNCTVTTPATTTQLSACGQTITSMGNAVYANIVPFISGYRFRITDPINIANTQVIERNVREFRMSLITNFAVQYGKQYNVEVAVKNTDGSWLPYGNICSVTTPVFPTTSLQDSQCDDYQVPNNSAQIYANSYPGAIAYVFQLSGGGLPAPVEVTKSTRTFVLNNFAGQLMPGATYDVKVRLIFNLSDPAGPYGKTCTITTPGLSRTVKPKTAFNAVAYPNPFTNDFNIGVTTASSEQIHIKVYDMTGRLLEHKIIKADSTFQSGINYPAGVYNVIVSQGEEVKTLRLIKR